MSFQATFKTEGFSPNELIARNAQLLISEPITVAAAQGALKRGALLGRVTASGEYKLSAAGASDGSQTPLVVLVDDVDASAADAAALIFTRGDFQSQAVILGAGHTVASVKAALADIGIFLIDTQA
jgi:hypothetical protein